MTRRLVILGAAGDLTGRYLLPALAELEQGGRCDDLEIVGISRDRWDTSEFRDHAYQQLVRHSSHVAADARSRTVQRLSFLQGDATDVDVLRGAIEGGTADVVAYLALPPAVFGPAIEALGKLGNKGLRLVIEKPFGTSLASAEELNLLLHAYFPEDAIFRMDHFLGMQTVQNILGVRFANRLFEPLWCREHVDQVDIIWDETVALEGRAEYYDSTGALRDMIQNHLLQLLALVAMERPHALDADRLGDSKVEALRSVARPGPADVGSSITRARYSNGRVNERAIPDYGSEEGVDPERATETFAEVTLMIDNDRWESVPFRLRTGKALAADRREIRLSFRDVDPLPFAPSDRVQKNRLTLAMDPDRMELDILLNGAGDPFNLEPARLDADLARQELPAYARLLLDTFEGDPTLSVRGDEAEESWRIVEPILDAWGNGHPPLLPYPAGSEGPHASHDA